MFICDMMSPNYIISLYSYLLQNIYCGNNAQVIYFGYCFADKMLWMFAKI